MFALDLHTHTRFFHGRRRLGDRFDPVGYELLARMASRRDLDGIATTNHDYYTRFDSGHVATLPGIEVSTSRGHVLVIGPDPPAESEPGALSPAEAVDLAHERGCAAIVAHPFRNSTVRESDEVPFDAIEINGKHPRSRPLVEELAESRDLPLVGGSDAHYPFEVGRAYTLVDADRLTPEAVVDAIRDGRVEGRVTHGGINRVLQRIYRESHRRRGQIDALEVPTPGMGSPPGEESGAGAGDADASRSASDVETGETGPAASESDADSR